MARRSRTPEETYDIYLAIRARLATASDRVQVFREISRAALLLNRVAPSFFVLVGQLLLGDAVLEMCRLTDPAQDSSGRERLTARLLKRLIRGAPSVDRVNTAMRPLRELRNTWIGHSDLQAQLEGRRATLLLHELDDAIEELNRWLDAAARVASFDEHEPIDQGTWLGAESLVAAIRDAQAVGDAYESLLAVASRGDDAATANVDGQLTANRAAWERPPFSELEWLQVRRKVMVIGLQRTLRELPPTSPYATILMQVQDPERELTANWRDRRLAARIYDKADWLIRELQRRAGERVTGLGFSLYPETQVHPETE